MLSERSLFISSAYSLTFFAIGSSFFSAESLQAQIETARSKIKIAEIILFMLFMFVIIAFAVSKASFLSFLRRVVL